MLKIKRKCKFIAWILIILAVIILYSYRVYKVNHSGIVEYLPEKEVHSMNENVSIPPGFYNSGYVDMSGYFINVTNCRIWKISDLLEDGYFDDDEITLMDQYADYDWIVIVTAYFYFDGDSDPLIGIIDLSNFRIVGTDYYLNCNTELTEIGIFNTILSGNSQFSIASGNNIEIQLPFLIDTKSIWAVEPEFIFEDSLLLVSQYPHELYIKLQYS